MPTRRQILKAAALLAAGRFLSSQPARAETEMETHQRWMRRALECGARNPRAPFGAVVVDRAADREVAWGVNHTVNGPIWHGEMDALQACPLREQGFEWSRLALYTTAEPCSMCQSAIVWAGLPLVVFGTSIARLTELGWGQIEISADEVVKRSPFAKCQLVGGVLAQECDETFRAAMQLRRVSSP